MPGDNHLLAIGITDYAPDTGQTPATYAEDDARDLATIFQERFGFSTTLLLGKEATDSAIRQAIHAIGKKPGTTFVFAYCGHSSYLRGNYTLFPYNCGPEGLFGIPFSFLSNHWEHDFGYRQIFSILDACRTEPGARGVRGFAAESARDLEAVLAKSDKRVEVLYGCSEGECCWGYHELRHGLLTAALLDVIAKHPADVELDTRTLIESAADWMLENPHRQKYGETRRQSPKFYGTPSVKNRIILSPGKRITSVAPITPAAPVKAFVPPVKVMPPVATPPPLPVAATTALTAYLTIDSQPPGAVIRVDGMHHGSTPLRVPLAAGTHLLNARLNDESHDHQITFKGTEDRWLNFTFERMPQPYERLSRGTLVAMLALGMFFFVGGLSFNSAAGACIGCPIGFFLILVGISIHFDRRRLRRRALRAVPPLPPQVTVPPARPLRQFPGPPPSPPR